VRLPLTIAALLLLAAAPVLAQPVCLTGFDIGSSGIRVGSTTGTLSGKVAIDYLADVWADGRIDATNDQTAQALVKLAQGSPCPAVAGAYSAWRLAAEKGGPDKVAETLRTLHDRTGVAIFVIPQAVEGSYGYYAARQALGERLSTPYILDIGGGSMQFAARDNGWGAALGQKAWAKTVCAELKHSPAADCLPNPVGTDAGTRAQAVLAPLVAEARKTVGSGLAVTAISSPVVRGIHPILRYLAKSEPALAGHVDGGGFDLAALDIAIRLLAELDDDGIRARLTGCRDCAPQFVRTNVTDMLLVQGLMAGLDIPRLEVAEADITNVPGLLADSRAAGWAGHYACYLDRLAAQGVDAYGTSPDTCGR
jgi:hypothetical protein